MNVGDMYEYGQLEESVDCDGCGKFIELQSAFGCKRNTAQLYCRKCWPEHKDSCGACF